MPGSGSLVLYSLWPPFRKRVRVERITVRGFLDLLRHVVGKIPALRQMLGRDPDDKDLLAAMGEAEVVLFADLVCPGERPGFMRGWLGGYLMERFTRRNIRGLLDASAEAEGPGGWTRILACLAKPGQRGERGGIMADMVTIGKLLGIDPLAKRDEWAMQDYIMLCESLNLMAQREEEEPPAASAAMLGGIPGIGVVH